MIIFALLLFVVLVLSHAFVVFMFASSTYLILCAFVDPFFKLIVSLLPVFVTMSSHHAKVSHVPPNLYHVVSGPRACSL